MSIGWASRQLIAELDLRVEFGETLCLVGPGGSGKSTTLRVLDQIVRGRDTSPDTGVGEELWWRGRSTIGVDGCVHLRQRGESRRSPIAMLLAGLGLDCGGAWMPAGLVERAQLEAVLDSPLAEAPEPLRRFVSFVLAAYADAPLLLFDEPGFGLREPWLSCVRARLAVLAQERRTMVVVTHYLPLAQAIADQVILIIDGQIIESADNADFFARARQLRTRQFLRWGG